MSNPNVLAEYGQYRDTGCRYSPSCLACPLPACIHDVPEGLRKVKTRVWHGKIKAALRDGETPDTLAERFGVSTRTVYRALKRPDRS
tara:strand:- start:1214 stop:1474 length:261 start_codon:yes stop_codon:yes gene_type:complete